MSCSKKESTNVNSILSPLKWVQATILCCPFSGLLSPVSISPALWIKPAISSIAVKNSTDWVNPDTVGEL